jgi:hypothetical protein
VACPEARSRRSGALLRAGRQRLGESKGTSPMQTYLSKAKTDTDARDRIQLVAGALADGHGAVWVGEDAFVAWRWPGRDGSSTSY